MDCCQNLNINFETVYKNGGFAAETILLLTILLLLLLYYHRMACLLCLEHMEEAKGGIRESYSAK